MAPPDFDALVRTLRRASSRRKTLGSLLGGLVGLLLTVDAQADHRGGKRGGNARARRHADAHGRKRRRGQSTGKDPKRCRTAGQPCKSTDQCCASLNCVASSPGAPKRCTPCGAVTQACCTGGNACGQGLTCGQQGVCVSCGSTITLALALEQPTPCSGVTTFTATAQGEAAPYRFQWSVNGTVQTGTTGGTLILQPQLDGSCRTVEVELADCVSVPASATQSISQCVATTDCGGTSDQGTLALTYESGCSGVTAFTATPQGCPSPLTFRWVVDGQVQTGINGPTLSLQPQLDGTCHIVGVSVEGCATDPAVATQSISQCVTTTAC